MGGSLNGRISYGPIGAPQRWPLETISSPGEAQSFAAFRIPTGYGLVWNIFEEARTPNLFSTTVGPNFEGGEPRAPLRNSALFPGGGGWPQRLCRFDLLSRRRAEVDMARPQRAGAQRSVIDHRSRLDCP